MRDLSQRFLAVAASILLGCIGSTISAAESDVFAGRVAPLLAAKCGACHGPESPESGFRIDDREKAFAGGDSGTAGIVPGKPDESELFVRIATDDRELRMPAAGDPLTADEQKILRDWIAAGAAWPDSSQSLAGLLPESSPKPTKGENHWAFQPLARPPVPAAPTGTAPIDAFVFEKLAATKLSMNPEADPRTLIRRLSFDLVGLPPTPEEITAFEEG
jgi:mono/diheme cytochrome c family protein